MHSRKTVRLHENLEFVSKRVLKIKLQRIEETLPAVKEILSKKPVPEIGISLCSDMCKTAPRDRIQNVPIKVEEGLKAEVIEVPEQISFPEIKAESESITPVPQTAPCMCSDTCQTTSQDISIKVEEGFDVEVGEGPEAISFPEIKAESECVLNEHEPTCDEEPSCSYNKYNKPFTLQTTLNMDEQTHNDDCSFPGNVCNKLMNTDGVLESHKSFSEEGYQKKHQSIRNAECHYSCDICHKSYRQNSDVKKHEYKQGGEHRYLCDVCNKLFCQVNKLKMHHFVQSGKRPYVCEICNKFFSQPGNLKRHNHIHSGERPYSCDLCHKQFTLKADVMKHLRIHSGERPYVCKVCDKAFNQPSNLKRHHRIHSGERPYPCDVCHKKFTLKADLMKHLRIHSGERPYVCKVCDKSFSQQSSLKRHHRVHSGEDPSSSFTDITTH